jgi:hypothetical protein
MDVILAPRAPQSPESWSACLVGTDRGGSGCFSTEAKNRGVGERGWKAYGEGHLRALILLLWLMS